MHISAVLIPLGIFAGMGLIFGVILAVASHIFRVKVDERVPKILEALPGANCGGCGYSGCAALAEAIAKGEAKPGSCNVGGAPVAEKIGEIMGVAVEAPVRRRAQVMCSGTECLAHKKYIYEGAHDCLAAVKLGGGDKMCQSGCIGLGTCVAACSYGAISVIDGVAAVDYKKCEGCGSCVAKCPKHLIELIPYDATYWVGCKTVVSGKETREKCDVGCISCKLCTRVCETGAIRVEGFGAKIEYDKCVSCGKCIEKCPRHIIHTGKGGLARPVIIQQ